MTTNPDRSLEARFESIRRAMAAVATHRPTPEQIAEWNTADREMAQRIRAALPGVPLHHAYAVLQALRARQELDAAAAVPVVSPPATDRAGLLAELIAMAEEWDGHITVQELRRMAVEAQQQPDTETLAADPLPVQHAPGTASLCPGCRAKGYSVCMADEEASPREIVHGCPPDGSGLTPCCGRTPFELPRTDRISSEAPITCKGQQP